MNKRRIVSMLLSVILLVTSFASFAASQNNTYVIDNGHGEFKLDDNNISTRSNNSNMMKVEVNKIDTDLYEILNKDILEENKDYDKLIKVNDSTLLRVKEIKINLKDSTQIEKIIGEYEINPWMAKNIRELSLRAQEDSDIADELIIYTPKFKIEKNKVENDDSISTFDVSIQSGYYYKGYLGYDYMDDIWHASSSPTFRNIRVGSGVKRYISETIYNSIELASDTTLDYISYGGWSLAKIFIGSPVLVHEGTTGDVHQASLDESKWRKYTSIDMGNGDGYNVRAVSDRSSHRFENMLVINGVRDFAYSSWQSAECDNYNNLDQMAYRYRDMPWTERIVGYDFNDLTYFRSIN